MGGEYVQYCCKNGARWWCINLLSFHFLAGGGRKSEIGS
jgi:hypothetical protein